MRYLWTIRLFIFLAIFALLYPSVSYAKTDKGEFTPKKLEFPDTPVGNTSAAMELEFSHIVADDSEKVHSYNLGDEINFSLISFSCSSAVVVSSTRETCDMEFTFSPGSRHQFNTSFTVYDFFDRKINDADVKGRGIEPAVTLSQDEIDFGSITVDSSSTPYLVVLENTGRDTLTIDSIETDSPFSVDDNCGDTVAKDNSCFIWITFTPTAVQSYGGAVTITDNAADSPQTIALSGIGLSPGEPDISFSRNSVSFGRVDVGTTSSVEDVTVTNVGTANLTISSIVLEGDGYELADDCPATLSPDDSCTISTTLSPEERGTFSGTITVTDNTATSPETIILYGIGQEAEVVLSTTEINFGDQTVSLPSGEYQVFLTNIGNKQITIDSIELSGDAFIQENDCGSSVPIFGFCSIYVTFTPPSVSSFTGAITITDDAPDSPQTISLSGSGVARGQPDVSLSMHQIDMGIQEIGTTSLAAEVIVTNSGTANLVISSISTSLPFAQTSDCVGTILSNASCEIQITFTPESEESFSGEVVLTDNASDSPQIIELSGAGIPSGIPQVSLSAESLSFASQMIGSQSDPQTVVITNMGASQVSIFGIEIDGEGSEAFSQHNDCDEANLDTDESCSILVSFAPGVDGSFAAILGIRNSASDNPQQVALSGTATTSIGGGGGCSIDNGNYHGSRTIFVLISLILSTLSFLCFIKRKIIRRSKSGLMCR